ncbi:hypothetical protein SAMN05414139_00894 [Burkholderia sp. D7]|nr:hypothetical protein SAMN05414139_00894 [Burkholderia sp. D7]
MRASGRQAIDRHAGCAQKRVGESRMVESSSSGLPKYVCKRPGIMPGVRYRNAFERGTIYADLCGIRN